MSIERPPLIFLNQKYDFLKWNEDYVDLNNRDGNIEDFVDTNIYQEVIAEISFCGYVEFKLVNLLGHFGTLLEIKFI